MWITAVNAGVHLYFIQTLGVLIVLSRVLQLKVKQIYNKMSIYILSVIYFMGHKRQAQISQTWPSRKVLTSVRGFCVINCLIV